MKDNYIRIGLFSYVNTPILPNLMRNITLIVNWLSLILVIYLFCLTTVKDGGLYMMISTFTYYIILVSDIISSKIILGMYRYIVTIYFLIMNKVKGTPIPHETKINIYKLNDNYKNYRPKIRKIGSLIRFLMLILFFVDLALFYNFGSILLFRAIYIFYIPIFISVFLCNNEYYRIINDIFGI